MSSYRLPLRPDHLADCACTSCAESSVVTLPTPHPSDLMVIVDGRVRPLREMQEDTE